MRWSRMNIRLHWTDRSAVAYKNFIVIYMNKPSIYGRRRKFMSEYKDLKNKPHAVIQRVIKAENKPDCFIEEEIIEQLLKIFSDK